VVIARHIWQKLSTVEHRKMLIVRNYWQLLHELLAKPCLSSQIFGRTVLVSSGPCLVDEPTLNNRVQSKREADASAQGIREHST
jgi:hypothetical protein